MRILLCTLLLLVVMFSALSVHVFAFPTIRGVSSVEGNASWQTCELQTGGVLECGVRPSDDAFADNMFPTKSMKVSIPLLLIVQDMPSIPVGRDYTFLKFDFSSVLPSVLISSHARPLNASLWLHVDLTTTFYNASVRVYRVDSNDWDMRTLTWMNMPQINMTGYVGNQIHSINQWYEWDVTGMVGEDLQTGPVSSFALLPGFTGWMNDVWFDSMEKNVSTSPELDMYFKEPALTLNTSFPDLQLTIDGTPVRTDQNGTMRLRLPWGIHQIALPDQVPGLDGERELFVGWNDNVNSTSREINLGNDLTLNANYQKQYRLIVNSPYAATNGSGWYFAGEVAHANVQPTSIFQEGLLGLLGVRHVFDHWEGACNSTQPDCAVTMNSPGEANAVWKNDYTIPLAIGIIGVAAIALLVVRRRKHHK